VGAIAVSGLPEAEDMELVEMAVKMLSGQSDSTTSGPNH